MNQQESTNLVRIVKAACPAQAVDEFTADAWAFILDDVPLADAMTAVRAIARQKSDKPLFIDPRQVRAEVGRMHRNRLEEEVLTGAPEDPAEYVEWLKRMRQAVAEGREQDLPQIEPAKHQVSADFIRELRARSKELPGKDIQ